MCDDENALLAAVIAAPDDDLPRLVYADWLDEHGRAERAEFIRGQCFMARARSDPRAKPERAVWGRRVRALAAANQSSWVGELPDIPGVVWGAFARGFVEFALVGGDRAGPDALAMLTASAPVREVRYLFHRVRHLERFLDDPALGLVRTLTLIYHRWALSGSVAAAVRALARHHWSNRPGVINLRKLFPSPDALAVLAQWPADVEPPVIDLRWVWPDHPVIADVKKRFGKKCLT